MRPMARRDPKKKVVPKYGYGTAYTQAKPMEMQIAILHELFPHFDIPAEHQIPEVVPDGMEGCFAIPYWSSVARSYKEAIQKVFELLMARRKCFAYHLVKDDTGLLRETERKVELFNKIRKEQSSQDIAIVACQLGVRYANRSVQDVRSQFVEHECGLGVYEAMIVLLTHPERLTHAKQLGLFCAGDEYAPDALKQDFSKSPCITFNENTLTTMLESEYPPEAPCLELTVDVIDRSYPELGALSAMHVPL